MNSKAILTTLIIVVAVFVLIFLSDYLDSNDSTAMAPPKREKPLVTTTFYPTQYFAQRIAGDLLEVRCLVPSDEDAIFWMPDAEAIREYQRSDLIVLNGASFAKWVSKVSLPLSRVVDSARPQEEDFIFYEKATTHSHGKGGEHSHEGLDGHTWVDPIFAIGQSREIHKAFVKKWPEHQDAFNSGFRSLESDLLALDSTLKSYAKVYKQQPILASHPAYNYIAKRYGWNIENLDLDPETMPDEASLKEIEWMLKEFPAKVLLWESMPTPEIAAKIKNSLGLESLEFSPCELLDQNSTEDYLSIMQRNLENIKTIFIP